MKIYFSRIKSWLKQKQIQSLNQRHQPSIANSDSKNKSCQRDFNQPVLTISCIFVIKDKYQQQMLSTKLSENMGQINNSFKFTFQINIQQLTLTLFFIKNAQLQIMSINSNKNNGIKRSLRSINNCFKIPNMFLNKNQDFLTKNIQFIPKHVRRKVVEKQFLNCKDIMDLDFRPQRPKVDVITVRTAVKIQKNYQNIILQRDQQAKKREIQQQESNFCYREPKKQPQLEEREQQSFRQRYKTMEQCIKHQIPTEKEIKKEIEQ